MWEHIEEMTPSEATAGKKRNTRLTIHGELDAAELDLKA